MNLAWLPPGPISVAVAALISLIGGVIAFGLCHAWGERHRLSHGHQIAIGWLLAVAVTAGIDIWHLFYLGIVPLESPVRVGRILSAIHDPDHLGLRVVFELAGVTAGVLAGWLLVMGHHRDDDPSER